MVRGMARLVSWVIATFIATRSWLATGALPRRIAGEIPGGCPIAIPSGPAGSTASPQALKSGRSRTRWRLELQILFRQTGIPGATLLASWLPTEGTLSPGRPAHRPLPFGWPAAFYGIIELTNVALIEFHPRAPLEIGRATSELQSPC